VGDGKAGATAGIEVATNRINAQIAQSASSDPSALWLGARSLRKTAPEPIVSADWVEGEACLSRWTCPNNNIIWTASANSAKPEPKPKFDRNQRISMCLSCLQVFTKAANPADLKSLHHPGRLTGK
jgi:hypothetical protein